MYHTSSNTNPADFLTKVKSASTYLDNPLWEMGPDYMTSDDWSDGRSIKEIKERMSPTAEQNKEIDAEVKKKFKTAQINLSKVASKDEKANFISLAQVKSNDLLKVQRAILLCIDYLVKTVPKRLLQTVRDEKDAPPDENCSGGENSREFFWAMFNRKWYVVQKATDEETPDELRNRKVNEATVVKFLCDETYSIVPNTRIQPFGNIEIDEKRGKRDTDGYAIASATKHGIDVDKNDTQKENGKEQSEKELPELLEGTTVTFKMLLDTWSAIKNDNAEKIDTVMKLMIKNDQKLTFGDDYKRLKEGKDVEKTSELFDLSPFMEDGIIKMQTRLTYSELLPE